MKKCKLSQNLPIFFDIQNYILLFSELSGQDFKKMTLLLRSGVLATNTIITNLMLSSILAAAVLIIFHPTKPSRLRKCREHMFSWVYTWLNFENSNYSSQSATQWFQVAKNQPKIRSLDEISRVFPSKFQKSQLTSVSGHCISFILFHIIFGIKFLAGF